MRILVDGFTPAGVHVVVREPETQRYDVEINGEPVGYSSATRLRDGGTTTIHTEQGEIYAYRRMFAEHWDSFNGERLSQQPPS